MASSCIPVGLRLDLEMVKSAAAAAPGAAPSPLRPAHSSASSSTLSEASHASSASSLSLKRARTPRKRPNQTYNEAAALLASMYPSVFPAGKSPEMAPPRLLALASALADDPSRADLLPPLPVLGDAAVLLRDMTAPPTPRSPAHAKSCLSPAAVSSVFTEFRDPAPSPGTPDAAVADEPGELDFDDDDSFDAHCFLPVEETAADGIMDKLAIGGKARMVTGVNPVLSSSGVDTYLRSLMVLGLELHHGQPNIKQALKGHNDGSKWWMCPAIPVKDIMVAPPPWVASSRPPPAEKKKSKKKALKDIAVEQHKNCQEKFPDLANGDAGIWAMKAPKTGLGLSLNTEEVLKVWCDRGSVFANGTIPDSSSTDLLAKISGLELFLENGAGAAGAAMEGGIRNMRHKQKQYTPLLANKNRYQARKVNTECRPRVKGRFVSQASLLRRASDEES